MAAPGEEALGGFPDQHEIQIVRPLVGERQGKAGIGPHRAHAGEELEDLAQIDLRRDLPPVGIAHVGQAHGPQQDGVGLLGALDHFVGQRGSRLLVEAGAGLQVLEAQGVAADLGADGVQQLETGRHDLRGDAVARHHRDMKLVVARHFSRPQRRLRMRTCLSATSAATAASKVLKWEEARWA